MVLDVIFLFIQVIGIFLSATLSVYSGNHETVGLLKREKKNLFDLQGGVSWQDLQGFKTPDLQKFSKKPCRSKIWKHKRPMAIAKDNKTCKVQRPCRLRTVIPKTRSLGNLQTRPASFLKNLVRSGKQEKN